VAELATALGIEAWDIHPGPAGRVGTVAGEVPVVLIGLDLTRRANPLEVRFLLGRALARIRLQAHLADTLKGGALGLAVAAAVNVVVPGYTATGHPSEDAVRRIGKALARRSRRALEAAARELADLPSAPDLSRWDAMAALTADRVGAVLCGDVPTALSMILNAHMPGGHATPAERAAAALERPDVAALIAFAATEEHFLLRRRLKVALG
jgi:hypothetical protein